MSLRNDQEDHLKKKCIKWTNENRTWTKGGGIL